MGRSQQGGTGTTARSHAPGGTGTTARAHAPGGFTQLHRRWSESRAQGRTPYGTAFSFTALRRGAVTLTFTERFRGRLSAGRLRLVARAGVNVVRFRGRLARGRLLAPGTYTVNLAGKAIPHSSKRSSTLRFTIVAPSTVAPQ